MAEKFDLNQFYEDTKITLKNIHNLDFRSKKNNTEDKSYRVYTTNLAFGMLAHLNITSNEEIPYLTTRLIQSGIPNNNSVLFFEETLERLKIYKPYKLNPSAIPMIQRYRSVFDSYEKQHGIENPFTKKEGKEPGDN